jgi:signal transduction histidine kinase
MARITDQRLRWLDPVLCVVFTAIGVGITLAPENPDTILDTLLVPTVTLPLLWRRTAPLAATAAFAAGVVVSGIPTFDQIRCGFAIPVGLILVFTLAADREMRESLYGLALVLASMVFLMFTDPQLDPGAAFILVLAVGAWGAGRLVRSRRAVAGELAARSDELERTREQTAALAVEVERNRLATDLDVAAGGRVRDVVSLAESAANAGDDQERSREAFAMIEAEGRASLNEMRELLGVLRTSEGTAPRPTLAQLEQLLADARAGGTLVEFEVEGDRRPLPSAVELAAYRMVQHALEALAGGGAGPASVQVSYLPEAIELEVAGATPSGAGAEAAVASARERVTAQGGSFSAASEGAGRTRLRAHLPAIATGV